MRILMATSKLYPPQFYGGAEMSTHAMCLLLQGMGHGVAVLAALAPKGTLTLRNRLESRLRSGLDFPSDSGLGYPVFRGWQPTQGVSEVAERFAPDLVFAQSGQVVAMAEAFERQGTPVCVFLRHTHVQHLGGTVRARAGVRHVANSQHTAAFYKQHFELDCAVMTPPVIAAHYRTVTDGSRVVYINPSPMKGVEVVLALAEQRPDIGFDIVDSWTLPGHVTAPARQRAARLPNVRWRSAMADMRQVYQHAKLVLMPSGVGHPEWVEAWGRVATEAQVSGIPVIASSSGGLPEAVGPGGVVIDVDAPLAAWRSALDRLWDDSAAYATVASAALQHAQRRNVHPQRQLLGLLRTLGLWFGTPPAGQERQPGSRDFDSRLTMPGYL